MKKQDNEKELPEWLEVIMSMEKKREQRSDSIIKKRGG